MARSTRARSPAQFKASECLRTFKSATSALPSRRRDVSVLIGAHFDSDVGGVQTSAPPRSHCGNGRSREEGPMHELKWHHRHHPRPMDGIVEAQVRRWQLQPSRTTAAFWPVVTLSRESGSLGLALGRRVAARLGFAFWDQEIVGAVADCLHIDPREVEALDEHAPGAMDVLLTAFRLSHGGKSPVGLAHDYRAQLRVLFASIAHHGGAVIVGRGAHCVLGSAQALKVRLVAPVEHRIADYERTCDVTHDVAARAVPAGDKERAEFVRRTFQRDVASPADYDVIINVATYSPLRAESMVLMAYLAKFGHLPAEGRDSIPPQETFIATRRPGISLQQSP